MSIISKEKINDSLTSKAENSLTITPILDNEKQIGESTIDLRLGTKFEVDMRTRKPFFDPLSDKRPIALYPGLRIVQLILFSVDGEERGAYYRDSISKYVANSNPDLSSIAEDEDLQVLKDKFPINS